MKTTKTMKPEDYVHLVLPARNGGVLRGIARGMSRQDLFKMESKKGLDGDGSSAEKARWQREIIPYDDNGNGARETIVATFADDMLTTLDYTLHIDGIAADKVITAVTKEVVARLQAKHGKGTKDGKETVFSISAPVSTRLSVVQSKVSRGGETYSELGIVLSGK